MKAITMDTENDKCPKDWNKYGNNCYKRLYSSLGWTNSQKACGKLGATLAQINSEDENVWLSKTFSGLDAWIDATDFPNEGEWRWYSTEKLVKYTAWNDKEPNNAGRREHCAHVFLFKRKALWNDDICTDRRQALCMKKAA